MKSLLPHFVALALAAVLAFVVWSRGEQPGDAEAAGRVEVWPGNPESLDSVRFESPNRTVTLEPRKDDVGRYYVVVLDKEETPPHSPHGAPDAGAPPATPPKHALSRFIGVKEANAYAKKLAPLTALRDLGPLESGRAAEFGFDKPEGTLKVKLAGSEHALVIGGATPGGQERYAKLEGPGTVYAIPSDIVQTMLGAESRLLERSPHSFESGDVTRVRITRGGKTREAVAMPDKKGAWADAATPSKLDETIGNWLNKVDRLHVMEYVEKPSPPLPPESAIVRIDYFGGKKTLGYLELYKTPGEKGNDYYMRTENSRWYVKVLASVGEQVEDDAASIVK